MSSKPRSPIAEAKWYNNATTATVVGVVLAALIAFAVNLNSRISGLEVTIGKIQQRIADGGTHEIVQQLDKATTPADVVAAMTTLRGDVLSASLKNQKPNAAKIESLAPAVASATRRFPLLPETWQTAATLVSYRSSGTAQENRTLPDCDVNQAPHQIVAADVPETPPDRPSPDASASGFLFRDCTLHLDHLPPGHLARMTLSADVQLQSLHHKRDQVVGGLTAFIIGCNVILGDDGIGESPILIFEIANSRLSFEVDHIPTPSTQKLLLASLDTPSGGKFSVNLMPGA